MIVHIYNGEQNEQYSMPLDTTQLLQIKQKTH